MALTLPPEPLARVSARRPWLVVGAWAAVFAISIALISGLLSDALTNEVGFTNNPESKRGEILLEDRLRGPEKVNEIVIVRSADRTVDDAAFNAFVEGLYADVAALGPDVIAQGASYYQTGDESLVSADRRTTILPFVMAGGENEADKNIDDVLKVVREADGGGGFRVLITGGASVNKDFQEVAESDLQTGEAFGIPIALVVLVIVFGAITAALVPLVLGIFSIVVAVGLTALLVQAFGFSFFPTILIPMMGLAVGIDYSLFVVSRYREERIRGKEKLH